MTKQVLLKAVSWSQLCVHVLYTHPFLPTAIVPHNPTITFTNSQGNSTRTEPSERMSPHTPFFLQVASVGHSVTHLAPFFFKALLVVARVNNHAASPREPTNMSV